MKQPKPNLVLVHYQGEYFPRSKEDFDFLKSRLLSIFRIPAAALSWLQHTLLKGVKIQTVEWATDVWPEFTSWVTKSFASDSVRLKLDRNLLYFSYMKSETELVNKHCSLITNSLGRFGMKATRETKPHPTQTDRFVARLEVRPDPEINPSFFFGDTTPEFQENVELHLSPVASVSFKARPSMIHPGKTHFALEFQDKLGDDWVPAFTRAFDIQKLDQAEVAHLINMLVGLVKASHHYTPPVTPMRNQR